MIKMSFFSALALSSIMAMSAIASGQGHTHNHAHHHAAPHGGTLVALGDEEAHLELVLDSATGHVTGYIMDGEAVKAIRISQPGIKVHAYERDLKSTVTTTLKAVANPLTGEKVGDTSQFEGSVKELVGKKNFVVTIEQLTVRGKTFPRTASYFPEGNH